MYQDYFRLNEMPFSIAPDPRFLFMSDRHSEAIAHLVYGLQGAGGIVLLTGEVGTGKTTVCRSLLEQLPENIDVAFILNPRMNVDELLQTVCEEFHIVIAAEAGGVKACVDAIHARLLAANAAGRRAILIVDEAQNLDPRVLEQLRLLTNLETNTRKLLQIFLIGQPELQDMLARPELLPVAQRIVARYHLRRLGLAEVRAYVAHRLRVSGAPPAIFPEALARPLYRASGGVPRLINLVCDRALLGTYVQGRQQVTAAILRQAVREVVAARRPSYARGAAAVGLVVLTGAAIVQAMGWTSGWPLLPVAASPPPLATAAAQVTPVSLPSERPPSAPASAAAAARHGEQPAAAPTTTAGLPTGMVRAGSEVLAFRSLFKLHGLDGNLGDGDPCRQAEAAGMRCYAGRGGLSDLLMLDQPAILRLAAAGGGTYAATLTGLDMKHQTADLSIGGAARRVALSELSVAWSGGYVLVWKVPPGFGDSLAQRQRGPAVRWLRQTLAKVDGIQDDTLAPFDASLARRIRAFQLAEGIQPDGVVGPRTAIRLNVRNGRGGPLLAAKGG